LLSWKICSLLHVIVRNYKVNALNNGNIDITHELEQYNSDKALLKSLSNYLYIDNGIDISRIGQTISYFNTIRQEIHLLHRGVYLTIYLTIYLINYLSNYLSY
jgi:hypothetical protein